MPGRTPAISRTCAVAATLLGAAIPRAHADGAGKPPHVPVAAPRVTQYRAKIEVSGQIAAVQSATLAAQRAGVISAVLFHSGQTVAKGALLLRMTDAVERAQVALDQAKVEQARRALARDRKLRAISGVSQAQIETDQATAAEAGAQRALDTARENRRVIRAPFAGILGIRRVSTGDYIAGGATITTITQTSPLRVLFAVPETELAGIGFGDEFHFTLPVADKSAHTGRILALSPALNTTTRARMVEGRVANASGALLPGAFGVVDIATGTPVAARAIPATAINYGPLGAFIYAAVGHGNATIAHAVYIKVLATHGPTAIIAATGMADVTRVVAIGGFKLHDGETITPDAAPAPLQANQPTQGAKS